MEFLWLVLLFLEVFVFSVLEKRMWQTWLTPLMFLMVPYTVVLLVSVLLAGKLGLERFYFPSVLPWIIGLALFMLVSSLAWWLTRRRGAVLKKKDVSFAVPEHLPKLILAVSGVCCIFLVIKILCLCRQGVRMGSEEFGYMFGGYGWAGHLVVLGMALLVLLIPLLDVRLGGKSGKAKLMAAGVWTAFFAWLFFLFVNQVKSWIILPLIAGCILRVFSRKGKKTDIRMVLGAALGCAGIFFMSYILIYLAGGTAADGKSFGGQLMDISKLFVHYFTSGTMGLSIDMQRGILEQHDWHFILTPLYNIWYSLAGQPLVSGYNPEFIYTGLDYTNVRTLFGTLYVFSGGGGLVLFGLLGAVASYIFFSLYRQGKLWALACYAWSCTILFMGWFDTYTQLLTTWEIPLFMLVLGLLASCLGKCKFAIAKGG